MKRTSSLLAIAVPVLLGIIALTIANPAFSYLNDFQAGTSGGAPFLEVWTTTPTWTLNPTPPTGKMVGDANAVRATVADSFGTWQTAPNASTIVTQVSKAGETNINSENTPHTFNLICFICTGANFSTDGTLAITLTTANVSGSVSQITQADIIFNPSPSGMCFVASPNPLTPPVAGTCPTPSDTPQDVQTVLTHEVGHFFGLDHSAVVAAMMFPFAPPLRTTLTYDDVAGISTTYPNPAPVVATGSISGTVTLGGVGVFGAHVFANSTSASTPFSAFSIRKSPIGTLTRPDGSYTIGGVPQDTYTVFAEPLDLPVSNSDVSGYSSAFGQTAVQTNFTTRSH